MKIMDILVKDAVILDLGVRNKRDVLAGDGARCARRGRAADRRRAACSRCCSSARRSRARASARASRSRTASCRASTGCWRPSRAARAGIDFESIDGQPTHHFFLLVVPGALRRPVPEGAGAHLALLPRRARSASALAEARDLEDVVRRDRRGRREALSRWPARHATTMQRGARGRAGRGRPAARAAAAIGKSECALELDDARAPLVADDVVELRRG